MWPKSIARHNSTFSSILSHKVIILRYVPCLWDGNLIWGNIYANFILYTEIIYIYIYIYIYIFQLYKKILYVDYAFATAENSSTSEHASLKECQPFLHHDTCGLTVRFFYEIWIQLTQGKSTTIRKLCDIFYECRSTDVSTAGLGTHWPWRNTRENISASCGIQLSWYVSLYLVRSD